MSKLITKYGKSFTILPNTFIMNPDVSSDAKCLMLVLQQYAWTNNEVFPSIKSLLYHLGWSEHTYRRARKELEEKGFIEVQQQKEEGKFGHNIYILNPEHIYELSVCQNIEDEIIDGDKTSTNNTNIYNKTNINNNTNIYNKQKSLFAKNDLYSQVIDYLNAKNNSKFKSTSKETVKLIDVLVKEGYTLDDFKYVLDIKYDEWVNTEFIQYYTPSTLFKLDKFEKYVNQKPVIKPKNKPVDSFDGQEVNRHTSSNRRRV